MTKFTRMFSFVVALSSLTAYAAVKSDIGPDSSENSGYNVWYTNFVVDQGLAPKMVGRQNVARKCVWVGKGWATVGDWQAC